jgi:succinoglycan biosynthesis transport protein ExoP
MCPQPISKVTMDNFDIDLRSLIGLLRRRLRNIIIITVVVVGATALAVFSLTPIYTAGTLVLVDTSYKNLLAPELSISSTMDNARVESEMEIMQSDAIALQLVQKLNLVADPEFGVKLGTVDRLLAFLQLAEPSLPTGETALQRVLSNVSRALQVQRRGYTNVIELQVRSEDPAKAAAISNAWATAYIEDQISAKIDGVLQSRNILQSRLADAQGAVVKSEGALDGFINDNLGRIVDESGRTDVAQLRQQIELLNSGLGRNTNLVNMAQTSLQQRDWATLAQTLQSDALGELERQRAELTRTIGSVGQTDTINLKAELARIEQQLVDAAAGEITTLRQAVNLDQTREADLRQQLRTTVLSGSLSPELLAGIYELQQTSELARQQYQTLLTRVRDYDAQAALQVADSRLVSPALPPSGKSFPNTNLSLLLAGIVGLGIGVTLAFIYEHMIGGMHTEEQAQAVLKTSVAAAIPKAKGGLKLDPGTSLADALVAAPFSTFAEGIRRIKVTIDQSTRRRKVSWNPLDPSSPVTILVTSSTAAEGKSTIALSLARAYASTRQKVIIIDCDLRRSGLQKAIQASTTDASLTDYLVDDTGTVEIPSLIRRDPLATVDYLVASRPSTVPTDELVSGDRLAHVLDYAHKNYDVVILDTPPVGPVVDALYLVARADVILFVVRSGTTTQTEARMALAAINSSRTEKSTLFAVLNQQEQSSATYKSKYDSYYFSEST